MELLFYFHLFIYIRQYLVVFIYRYVIFNENLVNSIVLDLWLYMLSTVLPLSTPLVLEK